MKMKYGVLIALCVLTSLMFTACSSTSTDAAAGKDTVEKVPPHLMIEAVPPSPKFPDAKIAIATVQPFRGCGCFRLEFQRRRD